MNSRTKILISGDVYYGLMKLKRKGLAITTSATFELNKLKLPSLGIPIKLGRGCSVLYVFCCTKTQETGATYM